MLKALADILWLVAFAIFFMMLASVSFYLFLIALSDWMVIPAALVGAGVIYLVSRWLTGWRSRTQMPRSRMGWSEMAARHFNRLRGK